jgi:hypothetical protein
MSKLICGKCQGTLFVPTSVGIVYSVYVSVDKSKQ